MDKSVRLVSPSNFAREDTSPGGIWVIGIGHPYGGDDAVGPTLISQLDQKGAPSGVRLRVLLSPLHLLSLPPAQRWILVDALGPPAHPGKIYLLSPDLLQNAVFSFLSSHGLSLTACLSLLPFRETPPPARILIVGIGIPLPLSPDTGLSPVVQEALPRALHWIQHLCARPS